MTRAWSSGWTMRTFSTTNRPSRAPVGPAERGERRAHGPVREVAPESITSLWMDGRLTRLELQPLSTEEAAELLSAVLGGHVQDEAVRRMWSLTGGNVLYLHHILGQEIKADRGGGWPAARGNAAGDAVSPVAMPRAGSSSAMNRYPNAGSSWWIIRSRRIDSVSRYLWAKLSWVPDSSTFDGICGLVGRRGPRQRGPREGDLADRCQHTGGVGAALRVDVGVEHSVDLLALTEHW